LSGDITGNTAISAILKNTAVLSLDLTGNTTLTPQLTGDIVFSSTIDATSSVTSSLFEYDIFDLEIDSSSNVTADLRLISSMSTDITGLTSVSATMTEYEFLNASINASSTVEAYALTKNGEVILKTTIDGYADVTSILSPDYTFELSADITGTTNLNDSILSKSTTIKLNAVVDATSNFIINEISPIVKLETIIDSSSNVTANIRYETVTLSADITGQTTVSDKINRNVRLTLTRQSKIIENNLVWYYVNEPINISGNTAIVKSNLIISNMLRLGKNKRLPLVSPSIESIDSDNIDEFFKIMKLYQSLSDSKIILESTRRQAQNELDAYLIGNNPEIRWKSDKGTLNGFSSGWLDDSGNPTIPVNFKAFVAPAATGVFRNKDGFFAVYIGKDRQ
jgi:hypothetical protein